MGHVVAVGSGVQAREGRRPGRRALALYRLRPLQALPGRLGDTVREQQNTGYSVNGGFAEYVVADPDYVGHLPDNVSFVEIAPILCAGVTVYKGLKVTEPGPATGW